MEPSSPGAREQGQGPMGSLGANDPAMSQGAAQCMHLGKGACMGIKGPGDKA